MELCYAMLSSMENNGICIDDLSKLVSMINKVHLALSLQSGIQGFWIALENSWTGNSEHCQIDCHHYHKVVKGAI